MPHRVVWFLGAFAVSACAPSYVVTRETECGTFSGTLDDYREYLAQCNTNRFVEEVYQQRRVAREAAQSAGEAAVARRGAPEDAADAITAAAVPTSGRSAVESRVPPVRIAVLPAVGSGTSEQLRMAIRQRIEARLAANRHLALYERVRIDALIREQQFQLSDLVNEKTAVRLGRLAGVTHVVIIEVTATSRRSEFELAARLVAVEDGRIVAAATLTYAP